MWQIHTSVWVFSCKFTACFQNTFSQEQLWRAAFDNSLKGGVTYIKLNFVLTPIYCYLAKKQYLAV